MTKKNRFDPKSPDFLKNLRQQVLEEKKLRQKQREESEKEFWAVRMPTLKGLAAATCGLLSAPFNFVAGPVKAIKAEMWQASLFRAVEKRDPLMVKDCIEAGADVLAEKERSFLMAVYNGDAIIARMLFVQGANPDSHNGLPLVLATLRGHEGMAECLLSEMGANLDTSVFLDPRSKAAAGAELMALLSPSFSFNRNNHVLQVLQAHGVKKTEQVDFFGLFAFHTEMRCVVMEMCMGKILFADGTTFYLDPARQDSADAVSIYYRKRKLIPPHCKPIQRI
ncbi:MAG TPA: hypothetical protein DCW68_01410 [Rhodospirillaceae bacterium]|nr:MAG: hypothetical protein A2018_04375 [Alphaproteobacteria bacterium GWF2_58_20]HAU28755.1 hypothetical protein [Rhodospirillaceae bacterium]